MVSQHIAELSDHRHCGSGDILVLVCHFISQYHLTKESCDFMKSHHPPKFGGHRYCGSRDLTVVVVEEKDSTCSLKSAITAYL